MASYGFQGISLDNPYEPKKAKAPAPGAPAVPADATIGPAAGQSAQGGGGKSAAPPKPAGVTFTPPRVGGREGTMGQQGGGLPYGTGDNRRQAGQMPLKGIVGAPPSGGFRRASWGNVNSGSSGQGNMPGFSGPRGPYDPNRASRGDGGGNVNPYGGQKTVAPQPGGTSAPAPGQPAPPVPARGVNVGPGGVPMEQPVSTVTAPPRQAPPMQATPPGMPNWWKPQPVSPGPGMDGGARNHDPVFVPGFNPGGGVPGEPPGVPWQPVVPGQPPQQRRATPPGGDVSV
jgi:hypothetical protein